MTEKELEEKFTCSAEAVGGRIYKIESPENAGFPSRLVILPGGHIGFVDLKQDVEKPTKILFSQTRRLRDSGCAACVLDKEKDIPRVLEYIMSDAGKDKAWQMFKLQAGLEKEGLL